ncbi:MAG: hypothetical protein EB117_18665 [Betaproteobacteria bacterium]|nr:hypothetical protein [Betaproteobacteria bacterium]
MMLDLTPTWTDITPLLLHVIKDAHDGADAAHAEIMRLARNADRINAMLPAMREHLLAACDALDNNEPRICETRMMTALRLLEARHD